MTTSVFYKLHEQKNPSYELWIKKKEKIFHNLCAILRPAKAPTLTKGLNLETAVSIIHSFNQPDLLRLLNIGYHMGGVITTHHADTFRSFEDSSPCPQLLSCQEIPEIYIQQL